MVAQELQSRFHAWADQALGRPIPAGVVAFSFNLYEMTFGVDIDLIGCSTYSDDDPAWAPSEVFTAREPVLEIPESLAGSNWQEALGIAIDLVRGYLDLGGPGSTVLRRSQAVAVGFVDGDLERVWPPAA
jgi:hypothetical protein